MPIRRFRIRTLMIAVAVVAVVLGGAANLGLSAGEAVRAVCDNPRVRVTCMLIAVACAAAFGECLCRMGGRLSMRLPRMTARRWMIAVACAAITGTTLRTLGYRMNAFRRIRDRHYNEYLRALARLNAHKADYHWQLFEKYRGAAARPFLPVPSDPPEPE